MHQVLRPLVRPPSLHQSVQDAIRAYILDNGLRPGDALPPESELARQLGVGRNSVREAVKALDSLGVIEARRGSGLFVRAFSFEPLLANLSYGLLVDLQDLVELQEIRWVLETGRIEAAVAAITEADLREIRETLARMLAHAERGEEFVEDDRLFHQLLFRSLGNRTLLRILDIFWLTQRYASQHVDLRDKDPMLTYRGHAAMADAVAAKDVAAARERLENGFYWRRQRLLQAQEANRTDGDGRDVAGSKAPAASR